MNSRERVFTALAHREPDRVPHNLRPSPEAVARIRRQHVTVRLPESREVGPLSLILDAVHHRRVLRITYAGVERDELSEREIEPLGLVRSGAYWLVPAWCRLRCSCAGSDSPGCCCR